MPSWRRIAYKNLASIDWPLEANNERLRLHLLHRSASFPARLFDVAQPSIVVILAGLLTGLLAAFLTLLSDWLTDLRSGVCPSDIFSSRNRCCIGYESPEDCVTWVTWADVFDLQSLSSRAFTQYTVYLVLAVLFALISAFLAKTYAAYAVHTGIPEIKAMLGGFVIHSYLGPTTLLVKSIGLVFAVASGLSLGKEGPLVHVSCCIANLLSRFFPSLHQNQARQREILSSAAAAGISVAFGAPLGGVLFSLEEMSSYFPGYVLWRSFICAVVAAVTLQYIDPSGTGKLLLFEVKSNLYIRWFEIIPWLFMGVCGGIYGHFFIRANIGYSRFRASSALASHPLLEVAILAFITALSSYLVVFMRISTSELVQRLFKECARPEPYGLCNPAAEASIIVLLLVAVAAKAAFTTITFGAQLPAGVFLPTTAIGACFGRAVGLIMDRWQRNSPHLWLFSSCPTEGACISPPAYAVIGAASALGGVTRMTVSLVVIMFELSGAVDLVLQIMLVCMISKFVGDSFAPGGIYEAWIDFRRFTFLSETTSHKREDELLARDVMSSKLTAINATGSTLHSLEQLLRSVSFNGFPIVLDSDSRILDGYISRSDLATALGHLRKSSGLPPDTLCNFNSSPPSFSSSSPSSSSLPQKSTAPDDRPSIDLSHWVDQTPMTLDEETPWEIIVQTFTRLGLRYTLFTRQGTLKGIMTKKDVYATIQEMH